MCFEMDDRHRAEMRALSDAFRCEMARQVDEPLFDLDAWARIGHAIGSLHPSGGLTILLWEPLHDAAGGKRSHDWISAADVGFKRSGDGNCWRLAEPPF